ncbi:hypothetical protein CHELA1G11_11349 [Hyphomicrobiales bacterium]|nr:hypothetical protein CHELA1G11_11349 [Hyphomicrobiales bacterium]CAH1668388.1 hypothetical protein CHELA1G2_12960 [Hyphomicrobiales bacterium]
MRLTTINSLNSFDFFGCNLSFLWLAQCGVSDRAQSGIPGPSASGWVTIHPEEDIAPGYMVGQLASGLPPNPC